MSSKCTFHTLIDIVYANHQRKGSFFYEDSAVKRPCRQRVSNLQPSDSDLLWFTALPSSHDLAILMASHCWAHEPNVWHSAGLLCSSCQQAAQSTVQTFPDLVPRQRVWGPSAGFTCSWNRLRLCFLSAAPGVSKHSTVQVAPGPMLLNFNVQILTSIDHWPAKAFLTKLFEIFHFYCLQAVQRSNHFSN